MTVYLGDHGFIELQRTSNIPIYATVDRAAVNPDRRRFSFAEQLNDELITGDQVDIISQTNDTLDFISGYTRSAWRGYIYVDILGGIRLYNAFDDAITGNVSSALELVIPSNAAQLLIKTRNSRYRQIAKVKNFEFTTERETIDLTALGDNFRKQFEAGIIQGQGSIDCFWDHKLELCDPEQCSAVDVELPAYLAQLCIRLVQGSDFLGRFFIYTPGGDDPRASRSSVWYEAECIITDVTVAVNPTEIIESSIRFVTNGPFRLLIGDAPSYLLTEESDKILLEQNNEGGAIILAADN